MKYKFLILFLYLIYCPSLLSQDSGTIIENAYNKALNFHYTNKDSAYFYYEKAIRLAKEQDNLEDELTSLVYLINANNFHYDLENYHKNLQREDSLLAFYKTGIKEPEFIQSYKDYLLFDKGSYSYHIKEYTTSKKHFHELYTKISAIPQEEKTIEDIEMLSSIYSFLGLIYRHTGKYELATYTFNKDIALNFKYKDSLEEWETAVLNSKKLLSQVYEVKKEYKKANDLLKESLSFYKTKTNDIRYKNNFLSIYFLLAKNFIKQAKFKQALQTLNDNAAFFKEDNPFSKEINAVYGDAYLGLQEYKLAEKKYQKSLLENIGFYNGQKHQEVAKSYAKLGFLYMEQHKIEKGLKHFQLALIQLETGFDNSNIETNPNPKKVISKTVLITILKAKQEALANAYEHTKNLDYLKSAHTSSKAIIKTLDELRPEFDSKIDKQFLITETYPSIQKTVSIAYQLYKNTEDTQYINDAFHFMEKSKSILLLEAQRNSEATKYGNVPDSIIDKSQQFRANISHIEQELFQSKTENIILVDSLFSIRNTYANFLKTIDNKYPKYYALKYNTTVVSLADTQQNLENNEAILSYLVSNNTLYVVALEKNKTSFYNIPFTDTLKNTIKNLYRKSATINIQDASIYTDSYYVYNAILKEVLQKTTATDLVIIPDDILNYISFDALITSNQRPRPQTRLGNEQVKPTGGNKRHTYLLETHSVSYASSATILQEQHKTEIQNNNSLLVFAPQYSGTITENSERSQMTPLLYNKLEAENIATYFNTTIFSKNQASIHNFKKEVENYNILHFASHASANDEFPDYSYLAFSDTSSEKNLLYVKDLYNYKINADLVTLSACQTGIGKLQKGEGMLSLARAFNYAGTSAIVTTLWKIDDQNTAIIMSAFYENLSKGLNKKEALRQAKLSYLATNEDPFLRHPYYWSGIILTGNTLPITSTSYVWWFLIAVLFLILGIAIKKAVRYYKRKNS